MGSLGNTIGVYSSSVCKARIEAYEAAKESINNLITAITDCEDYIDTKKETVSLMTFNDEPVDNGKFEKFTSSLADAKEYLSTMVSECGEQIEEWEDKYSSALSAENSRSSKKSAGDGNNDGTDSDEVESV